MASSTGSAGLTTSLRTLVTALQTNQSALSYVSDNIANVNTTGYSRRVVAQETKVTGGVGVGVGISEIRRSVDEFLIKTVRAQLSKVGQSAVTNNYYSRLQQFGFGDPNSEFSLNNSLNTFYTRLDALAGDSASAVKRNLAVTSAKSFTNSISELANNIQRERFNADSEIGTTIDSINNILVNLSDINTAIRQSGAVGGDLNSLLDARDFAINSLKEYMDVDISFSDDGQALASIGGAELLGAANKYRLDYTRAASVDSFTNGIPTGAIKIITLNDNGTDSTNSATLLSASNALTKIDRIPEGKIRALIDLRDTKLPNILSQLDTFVFTYANAFNEIHNSGTSYPPSTSLTGTSLTSLNDSRNFSGKARISVVDDIGSPVSGRYGYNMLPLTIDFDRLNGTDGFGTATTQNIINEINSYYGTQPANTANVGPASDIRMAAVSSSIATTKAQGSITLSGLPTNNDTILINGVTYTFKTSPSALTDIQIGTDEEETISNLADALNASNNASISIATYTASGASLDIEYDLGGTDGNAFTLNVAGTSVASASAATLTGGVDANGNFTFDFDFSNLSPNGSNITFDVTQFKINAGSFNAATFDTYTQNAGERYRTHVSGGTNDSLTTSLTGLGLQEGDTFTVTATVVVDDGNGNTSTEDVTFTVTVPDSSDNIINTRYAATAIGTGDGELVAGTSINSYMTASLVDANGNAISDPDQKGYLKITSATGSYRISIDQLTSQESGVVGTNRASTATNRGLSHFFGLNNFFTYGTSQANAALNFNIRSDILTSPSLLSTGKVKQSIATGTDSVYTYELGSNSNEAVIDLLRLQNNNIRFAAAGGLPELSTTIDSYASEIYNFSASAANEAESDMTKNQTLKDALSKRVDDVSGVNIDQELASTISIQNAYSAAAKVLGVVKELFNKIEEVLN